MRPLVAWPAVLVVGLAAWASILLGGCRALEWLNEPVRGRLEAEACPGGVARATPPATPTAQPSAPTATTRGEALLGLAASAGGVVTGNPLAWAVGAQVVHLLAGLFRRRPRRADS